MPVIDEYREPDERCEEGCIKGQELGVCVYYLLRPERDPHLHRCLHPMKPILDCQWAGRPVIRHPPTKDRNGQVAGVDYVIKCEDCYVFSPTGSGWGTCRTWEVSNNTGPIFGESKKYCLYFDQKDNPARVKAQQKTLPRRRLEK